MSRKKFSALRAKMSPEVQERVRERTENMLAEMQPSPAGEGAQETPQGCLNCGAVGQGGYEVEDGPGPFCEQCWTLLHNHFVGVMAEAASALPPERAALVERLERLASDIYAMWGRYEACRESAEAMRAAAAALRCETE